MPEYILPGSETKEFRNLDSVTQGFIEAAFFTENDKDGIPVDAGFSDLAPEALALIEQECDSFFQRVSISFHAMQESADIPDALEKLGRDFWFTRNGHGVGFWEHDRWPEPYGGIFDKAARQFKTMTLYAGDDGRIHATAC